MVVYYFIRKTTYQNNNAINKIELKIVQIQQSKYQYK